MSLSYPKNLLTLLMFFSVVLLHAQCTSTISTFPYVEDFETSPSWTTGGPPCTPSNVVINDWEWGHPIKNVINSAGSGYKCWIVGDTSGWFYKYGERSWVQSPCFDFSSVQRPYIQFLMFRESEYKYDGAVLQYSTNSGSTWTDVGTYNDPTDCMDTNWYNYNNITNMGSYTGSISGLGSNTYQALSSSKDGWCGNIQASYADTTGVSGSTCQGGHGVGHWVTCKHCMPYLSGQATVLFRFAFGAGTSCNNFNGFAFDSVAIGEGTPNSANFSYTCVNTNTLHFTGIAPLCPDTFQWNFGDPGSGASNTILGAGNLNPTHTFSAPGTYSVTFTVKGGPCNSPGSVTQTVNVIGVTTTTMPTGCSGTGGTAIALVSGSAAPYTYTWSTAPAQHTDTATGLPAGNYTVTVTSAGACSATASANISAASAMSHAVTTTPSLCTANNGSAKVTESGGTSPYTYAWSNGLGTADSIINVAPGSYVLTITDHNGCTDTAHVTIANGGGVTASVSNSTNVSCHGQNTGSITISASGGTQPYTYHWGATTTNNSTQTGFTAGDYTITVTDANGCQSVLTDSISQPPAFSPVVTTTQALCGANNGSAIVTESGGAPTYTYLWGGGLGTADSISNVAAGSYSLTVTDNNGCKDTVPVAISNSGGVIANPGSTINVTCPGGNNGSITVNASSGTLPYTYHWGIATNTNNTQTGFAAGTYIITVTDASGCIATVSATISQPPVFNPMVSSAPATCGSANGSAKITESGGTPGYTYDWSGGLGNADSIMNVPANTYTLSITDASGCPDVLAVVIGATPPLTASLGSTDSATCNGSSDGSITINASNGTMPYTYHWGSSNTNSNTQAGFGVGSYTVTVTDSSGCSAAVIANVPQPAPITAVPTVTNVSCNGGNNGAISLSVSGGNGSYTFQWTNTAQTTMAISGLSANTYDVTVTDSKGCTKDTFATISQPTPMALSFPSVTEDSCSYSTLGTATVFVSGSTPGYTYVWNTSGTSSTIANLAPGTYTVTASDANHCTASASVAITSPPAIVLTPSSTPVSCNNDSNGTASVAASGGTPGYTYIWNIDSTMAGISNLHPGSYAVTVSDLWGCTASLAGITVANPAILSVSATVTPQSCASQMDGSITLAVSGGTPSYNYLWSPASGGGAMISGLGAGTYLYTVTDSHGCEVADSASLALASPLAIQASVQQPVCPPLTDGSISVTVSGGNPAYSYTWNNPSSSSINSQLAPGTYLLTVTDSKGCTALDTFVLAYLGNLSVLINVTGTDTIDLGQSVTLAAVSNSTASDISYDWSPDYQLSCTQCQATVASPLQTYMYYVTASDTNGCKAIDSVTVFVNVIYNIYIPNAFTPNGDGINDYFEIFGNKSSWKYVSVEIFDRWGEKVFESNDEDFQWDGTYRGKKEEPNVYVYLINVTFIDGHSIGVMKGSITLIR